MDFQCNPECKQCCYFRNNYAFDDEQDKVFRDYMLKNYGVFYVYPITQFSITIWPHEKIILEKIAKQKNKELKIIPKRIVYDTISKQNIILDYSIDADVCPFLDENSKFGCTIYGFRPFICKAFPMLRNYPEKILFGKCDYVDKTKKYDNLFKYLIIHERMLKWQNKMIKEKMDVETEKIINNENAIDFLNFLKTTHK